MDSSRPPPAARSAEGGGFGALRHRDFRLLWTGSLIAHTGNWMQQVAQVGCCMT